MDEVKYKLPEDAHGVTGDIDLVCASCCSPSGATGDSIQNAVVVSIQKQEFFFKAPVFGETKKEAGVNLVGRDVYNYECGCK